MKKNGKNFTFIRDEDGDVIDVASLKAQEEAATSAPVGEEPCEQATAPQEIDAPVEAKKSASLWRVRATRIALVAGWVLLGSGVFLAAVSILRDSGGKR